MDKEKSLTSEEIIQELLELLKKNAMKEEANETFELCSYVDSLEKKLDAMTNELSNVQAQLKEMQEDRLVYKLKEQLKEATDKMQHRYDMMKAELIEIKDDIKSKATEIVNAVKAKGNMALGRINEIFKVKDKLHSIKENVTASLRDTDTTLAKIDRFGAGMREANQKIANAFRTFADKEEVDYSQKDRKLTKTDIFKKPWEAKKRLLERMNKQLDGAIDRCKNMAVETEVKDMEKLWERLYEADINTREQKFGGTAITMAERVCAHNELKSFTKMCESR